MSDEHEKNAKSADLRRCWNPSQDKGKNNFDFQRAEQGSVQRETFSLQFRNRQLELGFEASRRS